MLIYDRVKGVCAEKGISISSMEKQIGLGKGTITKWNDFSPTIKNLKAVADILKISIDDLIEDA